MIFMAEFIEGTSGNDNIYNHYDFVTIAGGKGDDYIFNYNNNVSISGGNGNDSLENFYDRVTIDGGAGNDFIFNGKDNLSGGSNVSIEGGTGNDSIYNNGWDTSISGGKGNDTIFSEGADNFFIYNEGDGNDVIMGIDLYTTLLISGGKYFKMINGNDVIIKVGKGAITLKDYKDYLSLIEIVGSELKNIKLTEDNDTFANTLDGASIQALRGNDTLTNYGKISLLDGGKGNDSINNEFGSDSVTILGGDGNDTIDNYYGDRVIIYAGEGADKISSSFSDEVTIHGGAGNDGIGFGETGAAFGEEGDDTISGANTEDSTNLVTIDGGTGNDKLHFSGHNVLVYGGDGNDYFEMYPVHDLEKDKVYEGNATIDMGAGDDTIYLPNILGVTPDYHSPINAGSGNDSIHVNANYVTIDGGTGDDFIRFWNGNHGTVKGGEGNDTIKSSYAEKDVILSGGKGNDFIELIQCSHVIIEYSKGDGQDLIKGFNSTSTLKIVGNSYFTTKRGSDVIVTVGEGSITLVGATSLSKVNIIYTKEKQEVNSWWLNGTTAKYGTSSKTLGCVGKLKMANKSGKKNEIQETNIELVESDCDVTKFFNALEKAFDNVTLFVKLSIEIMFYDSITFVGDANNRAMTGKIVTNLFGAESFICKNFFTRQFDSFKQFKSRFTVMNLSAG